MSLFVILEQIHIFSSLMNEYKFLYSYILHTFLLKCLTFLSHVDIHITDILNMLPWLNVSVLLMHYFFLSSIWLDPRNPFHIAAKG